MSLTIEIRKTAFTNKGAAMMLIAAVQEINRRLPGSRVVVPANYSMPFEPRARLGIWHRAELTKGGVDLLGPLIERVPARLRARYGFVTNAEVDVVFDAAGFAYSDQWGLEASQDIARRAERWKKSGKKLVLLPQAFGPFATPGIRDAMCRVADLADLIFAREQVSYEYLIQAVGERETIRMSPDFTNMLVPVPTSLFTKGDGMVAIVPNSRMLDKASEPERRSYIDFLVRAIRITRGAGLMPFILVHETAEDGALALRLNSFIDEPLELIEATDPLVAKGIIAACDLLIGSRFHALVSALSQGVPVIGTGWSHKYRQLFNDYDYLEGLTRVDLDEAQTMAILAPVLTAEYRAALSTRLFISASRLKKNVACMWDLVFSTVGGGAADVQKLKNLDTNG